MTPANINKNYPLFYLLLILCTVFHRIYFRRFKVMGRENLPKNKPYILAANHQNALIDAMAVIFAARSQIVYLARADIFKKKTIARLLRFVRILPVYRIRDGYSSLGQNKETFNEADEVIRNKIPIGIFPEGFHLGMKKLKPLRKGIARMALQTEEAADFNLGLQIVPTGLDYSNYYNAGTDLLVMLGKPIQVADYRELYLKNPAIAINRLIDDLASAMRNLMIDIQPEEYYETIYAAADLVSASKIKKQGTGHGLPESFQIKKNITDKLVNALPQNEEAFKALKDDIGSYKQKIAEYKIRDWLVEEQIKTHARRNSIRQNAYVFLSVLVTLLLLPLHIYGMVLNYLPYALPVRIARNIKDQHMASSVRYGAGWLLFMAWYLVLTIIFALIFQNIFLILIFALSLPFTGIFAFYYYRHLLKLRGRFRLMKLKKSDRAAFESMKELREKIVRDIEKLLLKP